MTTRQLCKLIDDCEERGWKEGWDAGYKAGLEAATKAPITDAIDALKRGEPLTDVIDGILNG